LVLITLSSPVTHGQGLEIAVPRITTPPVIDGIVEQLEWSKARVIHVNIEVDPGDISMAAVTAQALLMEDGEKIYVASKHKTQTQIRFADFMKTEIAGGMATIWV